MWVAVEGNKMVFNKFHLALYNWQKIYFKKGHLWPFLLNSPKFFKINREHTVWEVHLPSFTAQTNKQKINNSTLKKPFSVTDCNLGWRGRNSTFRGLKATRKGWQPLNIVGYVFFWISHWPKHPRLSEAKFILQKNKTKIQIFFLRFLLTRQGPPPRAL